MSHFSFVNDDVLRKNIDLAFVHVIDLLTLSESESYKGENKKTLVSNLRKTIIIHTASIVEALLSWKLKSVVDEGVVELSDEWIYREWKGIYAINSDEEVVSVIRKKMEKKVDDLDFNRIIDCCYKYGIITTVAIRNDLHKVRKLRNRLHIGGLSAIEREYSKTDLKFCFNVAGRIKRRLMRMQNG